MLNAIQTERTVKKIRERLLERFIKAKENFGDKWKDEAAKADPLLNTLEGGRYMSSAGYAIKQPNRISDDRLEKIVLALEKAAGINNPPVV